MKQRVSETKPRKHKETNLLSVVVGLEYVADGSAVTSATRLQNEPKQPLVVLMG